MRRAVLGVVFAAAFARADAAPQAIEISRQSLPCGADVALGCQDDTEQEPHIAVNPEDRNNAVAVVQQGRYVGGAAQGIAYATTLDAGATWTGGTLPGLTTGELPRAGGSGSPWDRASDPVVAFDRKHGVVLAQSLVLTGLPSYAGGLGGGSGVTVNRSLDGGRTFGQPIVIDDEGGHDKNWIAVDNSPASPYYGRAYAVWSYGFAISKDGGRKWTPGEPLPVQWPTILVGPTGRVTMVGVSGTIVSDDGGSTWDQGPAPRGRSGLETYASVTRDFRIPSAAIDPSTGEIVIAFQDASRRAGTVDDIAISRSSDGLWWSPPTFVTAVDPGTVAHFTPAVAIENGRVYVTYRRRTAGPAVLVDIVMQTSSDGGLTFGPPTTLAEPSVMAFAPITYGQAGQPSFFLGDYMGLAVQDGRWYAAWAQAGAFVDGPPSRAHQRLYATTDTAP